MTPDAPGAPDTVSTGSSAGRLQGDSRAAQETWTWSGDEMRPNAVKREDESRRLVEAGNRQQHTVRSYLGQKCVYTGIHTDSQ